MKEKKKMLISFSGGETSGYMLYFMLNLWDQKDNYEFKVLFANTGEENEETLIFIQKCSELFNVEVIWLEAKVNNTKGKGTTHTVVDFNTATRTGKLFEDVIQIYGIPNQSYPHCNRELKLQPIKSYLRSIGWTKYYTAIGIRNDEIDRVNAKRKENRLVYPLISDKPMTKAKINFWWSQQPFRLNLKHYQGNCKTCWKKGFPKLYTIANENPEFFNSFDELEEKYTDYIPSGRDQTAKGITFFRNNKSAKDILEESKGFSKSIKDDSANLNFQTSLLDTESCDIFAECGE